MATNQERFFTIHPLIVDSSKLRFSQGCNTFNLALFNAAAEADRRLVDSISSVQVLLNRLERNHHEASRELSINPLLE
jgi:hypothetical protein